METDTRANDDTELQEKAAGALKEYGLISPSDRIALHSIHPVMIHGRPFSHFIITCARSRQRFFLKVVKEHDNFPFCAPFLEGLKAGDTDFPFPRIAVPEFAFRGMRYYIANYIEGQPLDDCFDRGPTGGWDHAADRLRRLIDLLASVKAPQYSEQGGFVPDGCADILKAKLEKRLKHPLLARYPREKLDRARTHACEILDRSRFSQPTLIHMDVKPANIICNGETGLVSLIDFEFARFGDADYGWVQILLSGCNRFHPFYREQIVPSLARGHITLEEALERPKLRCYLFYQTMCNLIYYADRSQPAPEEMEKIFHFLLEEL